MDDAKRELVRVWLLKARNDLETARQISNLPDGHLDAAIYHCQQAAEKAVKGFLAFHDHRLERTHDVERLVGLAATREAGFANWINVASLLTPYATAYRYPGEAGILEPGREEFGDALASATELVAYVRSILPPEVLP